MPYDVQRDHPQCPSGKKVALVKRDDGKVMGCHPNEVMAQRQRAAIEASEARRGG